MSEETVKELMENYSRAELDGMAEALGLNSTNYPNKRSITEAILKTREKQLERERIERERIEREREASIQELKKKMTEDTVKGKIAAIKIADDNMQKSVKALQSEFKKQMKENEQAIAANQAGVQELVNEYRVFVNKYPVFAKEFSIAVVAMQTSIKEQVNENQEYVKEFYG